MSGEPNRDTPPPGFSTFLPRGFGWQTPILPPQYANIPLEVRDWSVRPVAASVRQVEQLSDRLLVCCRKFVLVHLRRCDPAVVVHLLVIDLTRRQPAAVDAEIDVVVRVGVVHVDDPIAHVDVP